ncbi:MAG: DUF3800 domain-containing protein [Frankiaceae bacterium]|nr:DUF3800 domain-containing protein [Frankiaceae bacterium]
MLLAYVDESYDRQRYWIAGLVVPDRVARSLTADLDKVVRAAARSFPGIAVNAELHGHALFHGQDDWAALAGMARARIGIYRQVFDALAGHDVRIFIRGVHVPQLRERYASPDHPHAVVLRHLLERIDEHAASREVDEFVLVIADEVDDAAEYRRDLWRFQRTATPGYRARQITQIVDTMHFVPSHASRLVQAADLIAYLHHRIASGADRDERATAANRAIWAKIDNCVSHSYCWHPLGLTMHEGPARGGA